MTDKERELLILTARMVSRIMLYKPTDKALLDYARQINEVEGDRSDLSRKLE